MVHLARSGLAPGTQGGNRCQSTRQEYLTIGLEFCQYDLDFFNIRIKIYFSARVAPPEMLAALMLCAFPWTRDKKEGQQIPRWPSRSLFEV
jgi:hypothetical protein